MRWGDAAIRPGLDDQPLPFIPRLDHPGHGDKSFPQGIEGQHLWSNPSPSGQFFESGFQIQGNRRASADTSAVIFPSEYSRRHYARLLVLDGPVIPDPIPLDRIVVDNGEPQYVTFVNPQLPKGVAVFARIAIELNRKRPDIPLLVVEGLWDVGGAGQATGGPVGPDEPAQDDQHAPSPQWGHSISGSSRTDDHAITTHKQPSQRKGHPCILGT